MGSNLDPWIEIGRPGRVGATGDGANDRQRGVRGGVSPDFAGTAVQGSDSSAAGTGSMRAAWRTRSWVSGGA